MSLAPAQADRLGLGAALLLFAASAGWFGWEAWRAPARLLAPSKAAPVAYGADAVDSPHPAPAAWSPPAAQKRGAEWVYEVFTPPEIYYDARSRQFTVTPPKRETGAAPVAAAPEVPFGLELRGVRRDLFRLQLVGYVGGEGSYRGTFENTLTTETFLAGAGVRIPALRLEILGFDVRRRAVQLPDNPPTNQVVAMALIRDELTGETLELNHLERRPAATLVATVVASTPGAVPQEVHAGDTVKVGPATYRIAKIQLAPPSADVTKEAPDLPHPVSQTLTPPAAQSP